MTFERVRGRDGPPEAVYYLQTWRIGGRDTRPVFRGPWEEGVFSHITHTWEVLPDDLVCDPPDENGIINVRSPRADEIGKV